MSENVEVADERTVILVDEMAEVEAEDPTFDGMREKARLEEAFDEVVGALKEFYRDRFRHQPPADELVMFQEIAEEVVLPHEQLIHKLFRITKQGERFMKQEEKEIIDIIEEFLERLPEC